MMPNEIQAMVDASRCPLCGRPNHCQLCTTAAYKGPCWCMQTGIPEPLLARVPAEFRNKACVCRECVTAFQNETSGAVGEQLGDNAAKSPCEAEAGDNYLDADGLMVFTEAYLLRRGYCCDNGCRHCPYPETK